MDKKLRVQALTAKMKKDEERAKLAAMGDKDLRVRALFEMMLKDAEEYARTEEHYAADMKGFDKKVQWRFGSLKGYQVFKGTDYSFRIDEEIEDPDIILGCDDLDLAKRFLNHEFGDWRDLEKADFQVVVKGATDSTTFRKLAKQLARIPAFRPMLEKSYDPKHSTAVAIPVNKSLGTYKNQIMPLAVLEHFINKASHIYLMDVCGCRVGKNCQHHEHYEHSCMLLGRGTLRLRSTTRGHMATKEEAMDRARSAVEAGLQPGFGRLRDDVIDWGALPDLGDLFNLCYCCPCCCVIGGIKNSPRYLRDYFEKMEGLSITVDRELCKDCGKCVEVCIYGGREMEDGKLVVLDETCFGCGRCERVCPNGATSIAMEEDSVERMIARIESHVDIT